MEAVRRAAEEAARLRARAGIARITASCRARRFIGVDGSYALYTLGAVTVVLVRAVAVALGEEPYLIDSGVRVYAMPTPFDNLEARLAAEDLMAVEETRILERLAAETRLGNETLIVLDGPLYDPPRPAPQSRIAARLLPETHPDYHEWRASILRRLARRAVVAGYVKRPGSVRWLASSLGSEAPDNMLASRLLSPGEYTRPRAAPRGSHHPAYGGIYYTYARLWRSVVRVEALGPLHVEEATRCLAALTPRPHPAPVAAAHEASRLTSRDAEIAVKLLVSRLSKELGREAIEAVLLEEHGG